MLSKKNYHEVEKNNYENGCLEYRAIGFDGEKRVVATAFAKNASEAKILLSYKLDVPAESIHRAELT